MRTIHNKLIYLSFLLLGIPAMSMAAEQVPGPAESTLFNPVLTGLVSFIFVLLFAIAILANVLRQLAVVYGDKLKKDRENSQATKAVLLLLALSLPSLHALAQEAPATGGAVAAASPYISGIPRAEFYFLIGMIGFELLIVFTLLIFILTMVRMISNRPQASSELKAVFKRPFLDRFNKSVAVTNEEAIVLDHDYDGIRELDNDLPPWWKYGFLLTILVSIIYLWYYHLAGGPSQVEEYNTAMQKGEEEKAAYLAKSANNVDENTVTLVTDQGQLSDAQNIFQSTCAACHAKDGGGGVGPNLADDYWLHGGSLKDVFKTIKYGVPDKGMKSWKDDFSPKQIAAVASFVKSLKGTKPAAPKEQQGELFAESGNAVSDSLSAKAQPIAAP